MKKAAQESSLAKAKTIASNGPGLGAELKSTKPLKTVEPAT